jgi:type II secretory pathway pseudopilin PulG
MNGKRPQTANKSHDSSGGCKGGFTLIEVIGILAVLTILATIMVSSTPKQLDRLASDLERTNMVNYANALQKSILRTRYIPGTNGLIQAIATELGMDIKDVGTNARSNARFFLIDPDFQFYTNRNLATILPSGQGWQQNNDGAFLVPPAAVYGAGSNLPPFHARVILVSSLGPALANSLGSVSKGDFVSIWNAPDGVVPGIPAFSGWTGTGEDLKVQRIDLGGLFVHVILFNYNAPATTNVGRFSIDHDRVGSVISIVPNGNFGVDTYFLKGTMLSLYKSTNVGGTLDSDQILSRDTSFDYVQDVWRSSINLGEGIDPNAAMFGNALWATAQAFMSTGYNTNAVANMTPPRVVNSMANFMTNYVNWANAGFPLSGAVYAAAKSAQNVMITNMYALAGTTSVGPNPGLVFSGGGCTNGP